jgi:hypothetical protein
MSFSKQQEANTVVRSVFALLVLLNVVLVVLPMGQLLWEAREPDPDDTDSEE